MPTITFTLTPKELVLLHDCLGSKVCIRIFQVLLAKKDLNISAISRKAGCNNNRCIEHLKKMATAGIIQEEFYAGRHIFSLKKCEFTELMHQTITLLEKK